MKIIKETIIKQIELSELDFVVQDELLGENPDGHDYDFMFDDSSEEIYWNEGDYIPIQTLLNTVHKLKEHGVTHVQVYPHCDHHGYYFTGSKLEVVSGEETIELKKKRLQKEIKIAESVQQRNRNLLEQDDEEIAKMYKELLKLKGEGDPQEDADNV